jgi:hypothetical protein
VAKASNESTPAPAPAGKIIDAGKITMAGKSGLAVDARHYRWMDISDSGRPSPEHDYLEEAKRRLKDGTAPPTNKELANELLDWFVFAHYGKELPAALTIQRKLGTLRPHCRRKSNDQNLFGRS